MLFSLYVMYIYTIYLYSILALFPYNLVRAVPHIVTPYIAYSIFQLRDSTVYALMFGILRIVFKLLFLLRLTFSHFIHFCVVCIGCFVCLFSISFLFFRASSVPFFSVMLVMRFNCLCFRCHRFLNVLLFSHFLFCSL